jgi:hypothetical protein
VNHDTAGRPAPGVVDERRQARRLTTVPRVQHAATFGSRRIRAALAANLAL